MGIIIAVAISGIIAGAATTAIFQVFTGNTRTSNHMTAVKQVQNAGYWISHDAQMAQSVGTNDPAPTGETEILTLTWVGWERVGKQEQQYIDSYRVCYTYDADNHKLRRLQTITTNEYDKYGQPADPQPDPQNSTTFIADHITVISFPPPIGDEVKIIITASIPESGAIEMRTYEITPRPST